MTSQPNTQPNSSFSTRNPNLQLAIDSTSLGTFKECPRKYYLSNLAASYYARDDSGRIFVQCGYAPRTESIHLTFGLLLHAAVEIYHHHRTKAYGYEEPHERALQGAVAWAMCATWDRERGPWQSGDPNKNRFTLIRTLVWYLDLFADDSIRTLTLANGKPAVELSFRFGSDCRTASTGEEWVLCGHLDRVGTLAGQTFITDLKTTKNTIGDRWFDKFTPDNQCSLYTLAGIAAFKLPVEGIVYDAAQISVTGMGGSKDKPRPPRDLFMRRIVTRSKFQLEEWMRDLSYHLSSMEECAIDNYWPTNDKSCDMYGGCPFRPVCSQPSPESRQVLLDGLYTIRTWDPLQTRGDI